MNCAEQLAFPPTVPEPSPREMHLKYWREHCLRLSDRFPGQRLIPAEGLARLVAEDPTIHALTVCSSIDDPPLRLGELGHFKLDLVQLNDWELCARIGVHTGVLNVEDAVAYYPGAWLLGSRRCPGVPAPLRHGRAVPAGASLRCRPRAGIRAGAGGGAAENIDLRYELFDAARHARDSG